MMRYFPPNGTAGFATRFVSAPRRLPCPPAKIIAKHSVFLIGTSPPMGTGRHPNHICNGELNSGTVPTSNLPYFCLLI